LSVDGFKQLVTAILVAFADVHFTLEDHVVSGDKATTRWVAEGTHTGPLGPLAPTGRRVRINGMVLDRTEAGRVAERWELWDQAGLNQQLGI
jgi:predicted ester cyclase